MRRFLHPGVSTSGLPRSARYGDSALLASTHPARKHHRRSHLYFAALRLSQQVMKFRSHRLPHLGCDGTC